MASLIEAINVYLLGMPVRDPQKPLVSTFVKGILDKQATTRTERKQAGPLTVTEVLYLEKILGDPNMDINDRYASGAFFIRLV